MCVCVQGLETTPQSLPRRARSAHRPLFERDAGHHLPGAQLASAVTRLASPDLRQVAPARGTDTLCAPAALVARLAETSVPIHAGRPESLLRVACASSIAQHKRAHCKKRESVSHLCVRVHICASAETEATKNHDACHSQTFDTSRDQTKHADRGTKDGNQVSKDSASDCGCTAKQGRWLPTRVSHPPATMTAVPATIESCCRPPRAHKSCRARCGSDHHQSEACGRPEFGAQQAGVCARHTFEQTHRDRKATDNCDAQGVGRNRAATNRGCGNRAATAASCGNCDCKKALAVVGRGNAAVTGQAPPTTCEGGRPTAAALRCGRHLSDAPSHPQRGAGRRRGAAQGAARGAPGGLKSATDRHRCSEAKPIVPQAARGCGPRRPGDAVV